MRFRSGPPPWARRGRGPGGRGWPGPGGPRARRGDVRNAVIALLSEQPMHGYQLISELESRTGGAWRPSPGSIYPTLQLLEDEGLVTSDSSTGKRLYTLTDTGQEALAAREGEPLPWEDVTGNADEDVMRLRKAFFQLAHASRQVAHAGTTEQIERTITIADNARREIYAMLGEEDTAE